MPSYWIPYQVQDMLDPKPSAEQLKYRHAGLDPKLSAEQLMYRHAGLDPASSRIIPRCKRFS